VKLVIEGSRPIAKLARELGINEDALGNWVNQYRPDDALTPARSAHRADRAPWMAGMTTLAGSVST
jgi:transposase-like protein